jgi:hypothetical protein
MAGRVGVDLVVPDGFEAYARIHHRIHNGQRWADFAPEYLVRGVETYDYTGRGIMRYFAREVSTRDTAR